LTFFPKLHIVITGPESSGKSWLAGKLSSHYNTICTPEYARSYLNSLQRDYAEEDLLEIAKIQLSHQQADLQKVNQILFSDTGLIVLKIWSEFKYGRVHPWIDKELTNGHYDFFLLCAPDLPWTFDPLRENPSDRQELFHLYEKTLMSLNLPYVVVYGKDDSRLFNAINAVEEFLKKTI
jgi:NadR type nicotinamide-nucleotide adenylyltransferase